MKEAKTIFVSCRFNDEIIENLYNHLCIYLIKSMISIEMNRVAVYFDDNLIECPFSIHYRILVFMVKNNKTNEIFGPGFPFDFNVASLLNFGQLIQFL